MLAFSHELLSVAHEALHLAGELLHVSDERPKVSFYITDRGLGFLRFGFRVEDGI